MQVSKGHLNTKEDAINFHRLIKGKIEVHNRVSVEDAFYEEKGTRIDIYSRCGRCCYRNKKDKESIYDYTSKWNNVTDPEYKQIDKKEGYLDAIYRNSLRLTNLTTELLDISRIENQTLQLSKQEFKLNDVILMVM